MSTISDDDFLDRMAILAACDPVQLRQDPATFKRSGVLEAIRMAQIRQAKGLDSI